MPDVYSHGAGSLAAKGEEADHTELLWINHHEGKGKLCHVTALCQHHARSAAHSLVFHVFQHGILTGLLAAGCGQGRQVYHDHRKWKFKAEKD